MGWYKSADGGETFEYLSYARSHNSSGISRKYEVFVGDGYYYVRNYYDDVNKYAIDRHDYYERVRDMPDKSLDHIQGDTRYHCDSNIKPDKIEYIEPERKPAQGGVR